MSSLEVSPKRASSPADGGGTDDTGVNSVAKTIASEDLFKSGYRAIHEGVAILDLSSSGKISLSGANAKEFLNGQITNEVRRLVPGHGVVAAFPTIRGRLQALARIYATWEDGALLLEVDGINRDKVVAILSRFVPFGQFVVEDRSEQLGLLSLQGPRAGALLCALTGIEVAADPEYRMVRGSINGIELMVAAHRRCGQEGWDLFLPASLLPGLRDHLVEAGREFGVALASAESFETARIEAGIPREGVDAGEDYIVLETGLDKAISYTKGCYLGQETIAKIHWRGQPAKRLRGLLAVSTAEIAPGSLLLSTDDGMSGHEVGQITSSTFSPLLGRQVALGYVDNRHLAAGTRLEVRTGDVVSGVVEVADLPLVGPGSGSASRI